jgi:NADPH:quinone reductase-like Zn-dependent oxidoreductase
MDLEVARGELARVRTIEAPSVALEEGQARLRVDAFALTTNNITYAVFGDAMRYWDFFPSAPPDPGDETAWGRIPVWGFADVVETTSPHLALGERLYGYYPMSSELVVVPGRADEQGITDLAPHRSAMASAYNRYVRCAADPVHRADREAHQMLLYPLFYTSFVVDDLFADQGDFGAEQVVISSASSKTAIGVAFLAHRRGQRVVGLTSPGNAAFVEGLGVVDEVRTYDDVASLATLPSVFVDVAGNRDVVRAVHDRLGDQLGHSMVVGGTHWDHQADDDPSDPLPGPEPAFFFAPTQIAKRTKDWGREELAARVGEAWDRYATWVDGWLDVQHATGPEEVRAVYQDLLAGRIDPRVGHVCSLAASTDP